MMEQLEQVIVKELIWLSDQEHVTMTMCQGLLLVSWLIVIHISDVAHDGHTAM